MEPMIPGINGNYAYYVSRDTYIEHLKSQKAVSINSRNPINFIEPVKQYDAFTFVGLLWEKHIPTTWGEISRGWSYVLAPLLGNRSYYTDFIKREAGFFTFNGVTFHKIIDVRERSRGMVEFHFQQITNQSYIETGKAFMIMPFHDKILNTFYKAHIVEYLDTKLHIRINRADDFTDNDVIIDTIYKEIQSSEFIVCEISECNKNVFYEIGYARGLEKQLIFIAQRSIKDLRFFDVGHIRRIDYDLDNPVELQEKLRDTIKTIRSKNNL